MSVYGDSPAGQQFHVRSRIVGRENEGPYWGYVYSDEKSAREVLAEWEGDPRRADVSLWVRDVTPWRRA